MSELPEAFKSGTRVARKEHKCCECGKTIEKGEQYQYSSGIWSGEPQEYKQCESCNRLMKKAHTYAEEHGHDIPCFRDLREWFSGFICKDWKGWKFVTDMAKDLDADPEIIGKLLKIDEPKT